MPTALPSSSSFYGIYRLFTATLAEDENGAPKLDDEGNAVGISYVCTDAQKEVEDFDTYFTADSLNHVSVKDAALDSDVPTKLSAECVQWIKAHIAELGTAVNVSSSSSSTRPWYEIDLGTGKVTYHNLPYGYYFVDSNVGAAVMIDSTHPNAEIDDKNEVPTMEKTIASITNADEEDKSSDIMGIHDSIMQPNIPADREATVQLGDTIGYSIKISAKKGARGYVLEDSMDTPGLKLDPASIVVTANGSALDASNYYLFTKTAGQGIYYNSSSRYDSASGKYLYDYTFYNIDAGGNRTDLGTIEGVEAISLYQPGPTNTDKILLIFRQSYLDTITGDPVDIELTYNCTAGPELFIATDGGFYGNPNSAVFHFGAPYSYIVDDWARVWSARLVVFKYEGDGESSSSAATSALGGVKFVLRRADGKYFHQDETTKAITWVDGEGSATELVTSEGGESAYTVVMSGLSLGGPYSISEITSYPAEGSCATLHYNMGRNGGIYWAGPDGQLLTSDDYVAAPPEWGTGPGGCNGMAPGPDGQWGTGDDQYILIGGSGGAGFIYINGLTNGTYTLIETEALPGYNTADPVEITILNEHDTFQELKYQVNIANKMGSILPTTGGTGTTIFYILGSILVIGAGVVLVTKKRLEK